MTERQPLLDTRTPMLHASHERQTLCSILLCRVSTAVMASERASGRDVNRRLYLLTTDL